VQIIFTMLGIKAVVRHLIRVNGLRERFVHMGILLMKRTHIGTLGDLGNAVNVTN
jgi:hypothetical protein